MLLMLHFLFIPYSTFNNIIQSIFHGDMIKYTKSGGD